MSLRIPAAFPILPIHILPILLLPCTLARAASPLDTIELIDTRGVQTSFERALGTGYKVLLITKPWVDANGQLVGDLVHYRIRLNRGDLRSAVIFLRAGPGEAKESLGESAGKVSCLVDPEGRLARALQIRTMPELLLVDPDGEVKFRTPLLAREMVRQVAQNYARSQTVFVPLRPPPQHRPGLPEPASGVGRYAIR